MSSLAGQLSELESHTVGRISGGGRVCVVSVDQHSEGDSLACKDSDIHNIILHPHHLPRSSILTNDWLVDGSPSAEAGEDVAAVTIKCGRVSVQRSVRDCYEVCVALSRPRVT